MKIIKFATILLSALLAFTSCQKQIDFESGGISVGTLKSAVSGDCSPIVVNGIFQDDSVLNNNNYVDVKVNVTIAGSFDIKSDTINGYSFHKAGTVGTGLNTIRLYASGKPDTTEINTFTITYGLTSCSFSITVYGAGAGTALYTLGGSPGNCSISSINGTYVVGEAMTAANTVEMTVNVTTIGTYIITGTPINGVSFNVSGVFTNPGVQNIFLAASGTPTATGNFNYPVTNSVTSCDFALTFTAATPPAVYALGGSPGNCTGVILGGTYQAGFPLTPANNAKIDVTVSVVGPYSISTSVVNGIKFSTTGTFTTTGAQTVTLAGTGTPVAATITNLAVSGGGTTCNFSVTVSPAPVGAYTLDCAGSAVNGTYYVGSAVNSSNTISLSVNVTAVGTYTLSSGAPVNGISFSKSGTFSSTGTQLVVLPATGTPAAAGPFNYTVAGAIGSCPFSITAVAGTPGIYSCKIDGVYTEFTDRAAADIDDLGTPYLYLNGYTGPPTGGTVPEFQIFINKNDNSAVGAGTYNENGFLLPNGYRIEIDYTVENPDLSVTIWNTSSNLLPPAHPPFTIIVTSVTATRVIGTFSGQLTNTLQGSTLFKAITEGVFNLPIQ
ncbi:MAG: hypothetical protein ABI472_25660 [Ginsengibacter sp.]